MIYVRGGAVVLTYDPAGEGERNSQRKSGTRTHDKVEPPDELGRRVGGLMMTDIMQAVSYLGARSDVDAQRIAAMGYSMGSFILAITAAVETRLKACVLAGGGNLDGPDGYWDKSKPMCQGRPYRALTFLGDRPAIIYALHASRGPTLVYNGREDTTVSIPPFGEDGFRVKLAARINPLAPRRLRWQLPSSSAGRGARRRRPWSGWTRGRGDSGRQGGGHRPGSSSWQQCA